MDKKVNNMDKNNENENLNDILNEIINDEDELYKLLNEFLVMKILTQKQKYQNKSYIQF